MKRRLLLNVIVRQRSSIFQLLACKNESLLVRGNAFLVLDFSLDGVDGVGGLNLEGNGLACERLDEHLHLKCGVRIH